MLSKTSPGIQFRLLNQDSFPFIDSESCVQIHKACLLPADDGSFCFASCLSDSSNEVQLSMLNQKKLQKEATIQFDDHVINMLCIQLTSREKDNVARKFPNLTPNSLLAVLTRKTVALYDISSQQLVERVECKLPRGLLYIPLELKRAYSQQGCDGFLAIITVGKVIILDWIKNRLILRLETSSVNDLDFYRAPAGGMYLTAVLSTYRKELNVEDGEEQYGQLLRVYNIKSNRAVKAVYLGADYDSYSVIFMKGDCQSIWSKGLYICLVNSFTQIVWNFMRGEIIFQSSFADCKISKFFGQTEVTNTGKAIRIKEINGDCSIYEVIVNHYVSSCEGSKDEQVSISVKSIEPPVDSKIISYVEKDPRNIIFSGINIESYQNSSIDDYPILSLYEIVLEEQTSPVSGREL